MSDKGNRRVIRRSLRLSSPKIVSRKRTLSNDELVFRKSTPNKDSPQKNQTSLEQEMQESPRVPLSVRVNKELSSPDFNSASATCSNCEGKTFRAGEVLYFEYHKDQEDLMVTDTECITSVHVFKCDSCTISVRSEVGDIRLCHTVETKLHIYSKCWKIELYYCKRGVLRIKDDVEILRLENCDIMHIYVDAKVKKSMKILTLNVTSMEIYTFNDDDSLGVYHLPEYKLTEITDGCIETKVVGSDEKFGTDFSII